jgi:hypothetical protein
VMVKIKGAHGQMNTMIHKFQNFKIKFKKLFGKIVTKVLKILNFIIIILIMTKVVKVLQ